MVGNPYRYRAALRQLDNRHATAGCLLSLLFIIPYAARVHNISMTVLMIAASVYVILVVPIVTGYITTKSLFHYVRVVNSTLFNIRTIKYFLHQILLFITWFHELYSGLYNIHTTVIQVFFFVVSEKALCPDQRFVSLYGLLFCTMLAYLYQSLHSRHWSQIMFTTTTADFLRLTSAFIILRLGKGVAMSFVLITITLQFDHLEPSASFIITTGIYFIITQFLKSPSRENIIVTAVQYLELQVFEGLEEYWIPLLMNGLGVVLTIVNVIIAINQDTGNVVLCMVIMYTNVVVTLQHLQEECIEPFKNQLKIVQRFPLATREQIKQRGDKVCPVCLDEMHMLTARITPCQHIFHSQCLRRCILLYQLCPLCKQTL